MTRTRSLQPAVWFSARARSTCHGTRVSPSRRARGKRRAMLRSVAPSPQPRSSSRGSSLAPNCSRASTSAFICSQHGFPMQRVRAGAIVAEVHVELTAPSHIIRTGLTIVLFQANTRCRVRRSNGPNHSFSDHLVLCSNHFSPCFGAGSVPPRVPVMSVYTESKECTALHEWRRLFRELAECNRIAAAHGLPL